MNPVTKADLTELLKKPRSIVVDRELLFRIVDTLNEHWDFELVEATEKSFGRPLRELRDEAQRVVPAEFSDIVVTNCPVLKEWMDYTLQNEAPSAFHAMAFLSATAATMGRNWYLEHHFFRVYPSMAAILVGPSGLRKTTAINTALRIINGCEGLTVIEEKATAEGIIKRMAATPQGQPVQVFIVAPEMAVMFGKALHLQSLVPVITRGLDHDKLQHTTASSGTLEINDVTLGMLCGTTATWITEEMNASVVSGGFTSRLLFSYEEATARVFFRPKSLSGSQFASIRSHILDTVLQQPRGEVKFTPAAESLIEDWYHHHRQNDPQREDLMAAYHNRKATHLMRLSLVISLLNTNLQVDIRAIQGAMNVLEYLEPGMRKLYAELQLPRSAINARTILALLRGGRMKYNALRLSAAQQIPLDQLKEAMEFLFDSDQIVLDGEWVDLA